MNNVLKFTSCFVGLHLIDALNAYPLQVQNDSQLVVGQCQRVYEVREPTMQQYLQKVQLQLKVGGKNISITCILREDNHRENLLSKLASSSPINLPLEVWVEVLEKPNVNEEELVAPTINTEED